MSRSPVFDMERQGTSDPIPARQLTHSERLERIRRLVRLLDEAFRIPGTNYRVGLDGLIGLVPVAGDLITGGLALWIIREAAEMGVPRRTIMRMLWNVGVDVTAGFVPAVGDLFDVAWKANVKNLALLEKHLAREEQRLGRR